MVIGLSALNTARYLLADCPTADDTIESGGFWVNDATVLTPSTRTLRFGLSCCWQLSRQ